MYFLPSFETWTEEQIIAVSPQREEKLSNNNTFPCQPERQSDQLNSKEVMILCSKNYDLSAFKDQRHFQGKRTWEAEWSEDKNKNSSCFLHSATQKRTRGRRGTEKEWNDGRSSNGLLSEKCSKATFLSDFQCTGSPSCSNGQITTTWQQITNQGTNKSLEGSASGKLHGQKPHVMQDSELHFFT